MSAKRTPSAASSPQTSDALDTEGMLLEWGARLFYPRLKGQGDPASGALPFAALATAASITPSQIRAQVRSAIAPGATQVMVKITGGGRGMKAISAHFRYIGRLGNPEVGGRGASLELEDERGEKVQGGDALKRLADDWRVAGAYIDEDSPRREAYHIIFSMPDGTPPEVVRAASAEGAKELFEGHKYVFVLHEDQGAPHVHLAVRADRYDGVRLSPRKADLDRWRAVFARGLQDRGVNAVATRQPIRATNRNYRQLWEERAAGRGTLKRQRPSERTGAKALAARVESIKAWEQITRALASSADKADVRLALDTVRYLAEMAPGGQQAARDAASRAMPLEEKRLARARSEPQAETDRSRLPRR